MPTIYPPYVIERSQPRRAHATTSSSRLLMDRIVFLGTPINDDVANIIIAQMLFLEADNPERDIHLYINSPGGSVSAGLAIYDTMQFLKSPVNTICMGLAASMGAFLLAAGRQGQALGAAAFAHHDPPAVAGGRRRDGVGHRDPGEGDPVPAREDERADGASTRASRSSGSSGTSTATGSCRPRRRRTTASIDNVDREPRRDRRAERAGKPSRSESAALGARDKRSRVARSSLA